MKDIVAELGQKPADQRNPEEKKLRDLYDAFVDTAGIEKAGLAPIQKDLDRFAALKTKDDVAREMGSPSVASDSVFGGGVIADAKDSNRYVMTITQSGLLMPDRDYYLLNDPSLVQARDAFKKYLATTLGLIGRPNPDQRATALFNLETSLAKAQWPAADRRDANKTYNPMTFKQLEAFAPGFPWAAFFASEGLSEKGPERRSHGGRAREHGVPGAREDLRGHAGQRVGRLACRARRAQPRRLPAAADRGRGLRVLRQGARRPAAGTAARHARRAAARQHAGPSARQDLRREVLSAGVQGEGRGARAESAEGVRRGHPAAAVDDRSHAPEGARQAARVRAARRLSGQVARLLGAHDLARRPRRRHRAQQRVRVALPHRPHR